MKWIWPVLLLILMADAGCASFNQKLKSFLGGGPSTPPQKAQPDNLTKFSDNQDMPPRVKRGYKHTTRETMANDAGLDQKSGSLWVMEGQGAYLFAQNVMRLVGDPIAVQIDGEPKEQLQAKADVIKDLLQKIEDRQKARQRQLAGDVPEDRPKDDDKSKDKTDQTKEAKKTAEAPPKQEPKTDFNVRLVPTRIIERTIEGNYRVKGSQPFMIGSREFKVIVTGVVRAEDFSDEGIPASKLLDPKFDIVSLKRQGAEI